MLKYLHHARLVGPCDDLKNNYYTVVYKIQSERGCTCTPSTCPIGLYTYMRPLSMSPATGLQST